MDELFEDAAKEQLEKSKKIKEIVIEDEIVENNKNELLEQAKFITAPIEDQWSKLESDLKGKHMKRFNEALGSLPDREFVRVYLKLMEYVKPKLVRDKKIEGGENNNYININIVTGGTDEETKIIDITEINNHDTEEDS